MASSANDELLPSIVSIENPHRTIAEHPKMLMIHGRSSQLADFSSTLYANNQLLNNPGPSGIVKPIEWKAQSTSLFEYMEEHISAIEDELGVLLKSYCIIQSEQLNDDSTTVLQINQTSFERASWLKQRVLELSDTLETNCAKLDNLVEGDSSEEAKEFYNENILRQEVLKCRLDCCLKEISKQIDVIRQTTDDVIDGVPQSTKPSESVTLGRAPVDYITWLHGLLFIALLGTILYMYVWSDASDQWKVNLRLIRSPLFIVLLLYLYGINMKVWATFGVDYGTILNNHRKAIPTPNYVFKIAGILTVIFSVMVISLLVASPFSVKIPVKIISLVMWIILLAFLINPFNFFLRKARYNFILIIIHILFSPLVFVYFSDFLLADQFNSTVSIFLDLEYFICYITANSWSGQEIDSNICMNGISGNVIRPIVSSLPALWRFLQCLRCYYDSRKIRHLLNAGKYFSTFPIITFSAVYGVYKQRLLGDNFDPEEFDCCDWSFYCLLIFSLFHAVYTFLWDVSSDWGILDITRCNVFKRKLTYKYICVYGLAIILDLVLRFFWALKLIHHRQVDSDLIFTGLAIAEIFRRFIWNFFRVEYAYTLRSSMSK